MNNIKDQRLYFIIMIVAMLFWGTSWTAGKVAAAHSHAEVAAFWRYAIAFVTLIPVIWYFKSPLRSDRVGYIYMLIAGLLTSVFNYLFFAGLSHGAAGYGGTMVTALVPLFTYLMSIMILGTKITSRQVVALSIGIFGALILLRVPFEGLAFLNIESSYFLGCAVVWALVTIVSQKASSRVNPMYYSLIVFGIAAFTNMIFALPYKPFDFAAYDAIFWANIIYIGVIPGTFATTLYFISAAKIGAEKTGAFMFIVPIGAIISSWFIYGENLAISTLIGCLLAFIAVILFNTNKRSRKNT